MSEGHKCSGHSHGGHGHSHGGHSHGHGHHHDGGLGVLHQVIVDNELPLFESAVTWTDGGLWLDYGCGNGDMAINVFLPHAQKVGAKIIGIDRDQNSVDAAKGRGLPEESLTFLKGNLFKGDWPLAEDVKFDKILGIHVIQYLANYEDFFDKVIDLLKPGGELALTWPISKLGQVLKRVESNPKWEVLKSNLEDYEAQWALNSDFMPQLKDFVLKKGFEVKTFEFLPFAFKFNDFDHFTDAVTEHYVGQHKLHDASSADTLKADVKEYIESVYAEIPPTSKPFPVEISSMVVILKKLA